MQRLRSTDKAFNQYGWKYTEREKIRENFASMERPEAFAANVGF